MFFLKKWLFSGDDNFADELIEFHSFFTVTNPSGFLFFLFFSFLPFLLSFCFSSFIPSLFFLSFFLSFHIVLLPFVLILASSLPYPLLLIFLFHPFRPVFVFVFVCFVFVFCFFLFFVLFFTTCYYILFFYFLIHFIKYTPPCRRRVFAYDLRDQGPIPGRVIPKTQNMVLDASLLNT